MSLNGKPNSSLFQRFASLALALLIALTIAACGGEKDGGGSGSLDASVQDKAKSMMADAGSNIEDLKAARDWMQKKASEMEGPGKSDLVLLAEDCGGKIRDAFRTLVRSLGTNDTAKAKALREWAQKIIDAEASKEIKDRDPLAATLKPEMTYLWQLALDGDPNNADIRKKLGYVEHTKDLQSYLKLPYIDEDKDIKYIEDLIEAVAENIQKSPDGKKWLAKTFSKQKEYIGIDDYVGKIKAKYDESLKDPFTAEADRVLKSTIDFLKKKENLGSFEWVGRVHKPYLFIVERDSGWDESDVAEKKAKQLMELVNIFHKEYGETFQLEEIKEPMPIIVFKRLSSYRQYAVGKTLSGALGHFEHGSDRIVLSDEAERDTMFHEGTHQLMTYHTKGDTIANFLSRSYWFQEGVAEYFGGTAVGLDKKTKELTYELGVLQAGRLSYWRSNEQHQYSLWELIGLTFADRQRNISEGTQTKNLMVYSQGWLLVYFLYNFRADSEGLVQISEKPNGIYKDGFLKYMKGELNGDSGRDYFLKALGLWDDSKDAVDQAKLDKMHREYFQYYNWVNRKIAMRQHVVDRKLVPWDKVKSKRDRLIGDKEDDLLPPYEEPESDNK